MMENQDDIYNDTGASLISKNLVKDTINSRKNTQKNKFLGVDKKNLVMKPIEMFAETAEEPKHEQEVLRADHRVLEARDPC